MTGRLALAALVLDFDGLVLDTESTLLRACTEECAKLGLRIELAEYRSLISLGLAPEDFLLRLLHAPAEVNVPALVAAVRRRNQRHADAADAMPGVRALVAEAAALAVPVVVASSSRHAWVVGHLDRLDLLRSMSAVVCREDVATIKPAPDLHLAAARLLGVRPSEILALEDSVVGLAGVRAAGLRGVIVPGRLTRSADLNVGQAMVSTLAGRGLAELAGLVGLEFARPVTL